MAGPSQISLNEYIGIYRRSGLAPMTDILIEHTFLCKLAMRSKVLKLSLSLSNVKQVKVLAVVLTVGFAS